MKAPAPVCAVGQIFQVKNKTRTEISVLRWMTSLTGRFRTERDQILIWLAKLNIKQIL